MAGFDGDFAEFYAARFDAARRTAYALCGNWLEAEELAQQGFVRFYAKWPRVVTGSADAGPRARRPPALAQPADADPRRADRDRRGHVRRRARRATGAARPRGEPAHLGVRHRRQRRRRHGQPRPQPQRGPG
ncbi:MAG: hypothetical protein GEV28_28130 [Actinophytocola sp.]|nr:hypothetical protein [Actinophytocola sp.]